MREQTVNSDGCDSNSIEESAEVMMRMHKTRTKHLCLMRLESEVNKV